jgi:hypothetical protein
LLYVITEQNLVEGGYNVPGYAASHFLDGERASPRFETWARLTAREWQTLWRATHYGGPYADGIAEIARRFRETGWGQEELLRAWQADFAEVFPEGLFGGEVIDLEALERSLLELSPPGDFHLIENHCALMLEPSDGETRAWLVEHEQDIRRSLDVQDCQATIRNGRQGQLEMPMPRSQLSASWAASELPNRIPLRRAASSARTLFISRPNSMIKL